MNDPFKNKTRAAAVAGWWVIEKMATAALLHLGSLGNLRTQTARAYAAEMQQILGLLPK